MTNKIPQILYRKSSMPKEELDAASSAGFVMVDQIVKLQESSIPTIGRYSVVPFYEEVNECTITNKAPLINNINQFKWVSNILNWSRDFKDITPSTYGPGELIVGEGPFVLKGSTYSKKFMWNTHMFAKTKDDISKVRERLLDDSWLANDQIVVRDYIPLITYMKGLNDLPITKEFRLFFGYGELISSGFYWASHEQDMNDAGIEIPLSDEVPIWLINTIRDKSQSNFYSADVAQTECGDWILVEINEGQMSGLGLIDPVAFYNKLYSIVLSYSND